MVSVAESLISLVVKWFPQQLFPPSLSLGMGASLGLSLGVVVLVERGSFLNEQ